MSSMNIYVYVHLLRCTQIMCSSIIKHVQLCVSTPIRVHIHMCADM